ncbi:MAG: hypothetical protein C3F11_16455 [Methylocystaceae bacterium]|nr:MAG: hypothetical protein C3F11_16455 [Methylocystaceae bacterium]
MSVRFHKNDLEKWAAFSGDYNPIHFEREAAARLGLREIVVHGMLAMLPLKTSLETASAEHYPKGARWSASLLNPVPLEAPSQAKVESGGAGGKAAFSLSSDAGATKFIKGAFSPASFDEAAPAEKGDVTLVSAEEVAEKAREFRAAYPQASRLWVFLDALAFYLYVKRNSENVFAVELREHLARTGGPAQAGHGDLLVVHATHTVTIAPALLRRPFAEPLPRFEYGVRGKDAIHNAGALFGVVEFSVYLDGAPSLLIEMGLMAKN